ncbi:Flp pilus assembly protein CpaB [Anaerovorax odorimutans]|uniref:Flp pilus assembly protein CpaB n=1 Tax=Anaerovorax odorimutans TaxID=109327 RepID=UPI0003FB4E78|nr:Flp pilus assembly protein CpaB [Anaerovorax odorimutans]
MKKVKILALITAMLTALLLFIFLNSLSNRGQIDRTGILVAAKNIPTDTPITQSMITLSKLPTEAILEDSISDTSLVLGKIAKSEIVAGEQILKSKLITAGNTDSSTLSYIIKPGMRAITIAVDGVSGVGYMINPGNHVDIIAQYTIDSTAATKLIVENVTVLGVDSNLTNKDKLACKDTAYSTITLQVTPEQVMELNFYEYTGHLNAVLRSPLDEKITNLPVKQ